MMRLTSQAFSGFPDLSRVKMHETLHNSVEDIQGDLNTTAIR